MADRALRLSLPQPSKFVFPNFSNPRPWRFRNPTFPPSHSHLLHCSSTTTVLLVQVKLSPSARRSFSYRSGGAADGEDNGGGYRRRERRVGRQRRKRQWRWEELLEDSTEDDNDDDDGDDGDSWRILEDVIDNVWIFKVFKSYGYLLPFIIISFLSATGPKAFLTALAVAAGPSLLFLAFQKLTAQDKRGRKARTSNLGSEEEEEEKGRNTRVGYYSSRFGSNDNPAETGRRGDSRPAGMSSRFGGWDELESGGSIPGSIPDPSQVKNEPIRKPVGNGRRIGYKRVRREEPEPLLLRLLVSMFPFLSS